MLSLLAIAFAAAAEPFVTATRRAECIATAPSTCPSKSFGLTKTITIIDAFRPTPEFNRHDLSNVDGRYWGFYTQNSGDDKDVSAQGAYSGDGYSWVGVVEEAFGAS